MSQPITLETLLSEFARGVRNFRGVNLAGSSFPLVQLSHVDLAGANLQGINWSGADLIKANLANANLRGANLIGADLSGANLTDADLQEAILSGAVLVGAYLSRANLRQAVLSGAVLKGAVLHDSNLQGANVVGADFSAADLTGAIAQRKDLEEATLSGATLPNGEVVFDESEVETVFQPPVQPVAEPIATSADSTMLEWTNEQVVEFWLQPQQPHLCTYQSADLKIIDLGNDCYQLRTVHEQAIATLDASVELQPRITLFTEAPFADLVAGVLAAHSFLPLRYCEQPVPAWEYVHVPIPAGAEVRQGTARQLWKTWWLMLKATPDGASPQLQLLVETQWQPIHDIAFAPLALGGLIIKTAAGDRHYDADAALLWLEFTNIGTILRPEPTAAPPPWQGILRVENGCLVIQTAVGTIAVRGDNLEVTLAGQPIDIQHL
ncbi:pentapeptide repeat-containing protein [Thermosynechococcaceae cyanobacterium Okahandja]